MLTKNENVNAELARIRQAMTAALKAKPKNIAEYERLGAQHRELLHAHRPDIKEQWERCVART
jgi:hypothetical protein